MLINIYGPCNSISEVISVIVTNGVVRLACDQSENVTSTLGRKVDKCSLLRNVYFCLIAALRDSRPLLVDGLANAAPTYLCRRMIIFHFP